MSIFAPLTTLVEPMRSCALLTPPPPSPPSRWELVAHDRETVKSKIGSNPHGFVSIDVMNNTESAVTLTDGMNEFGLTVSVQTHRGAEYQDRKIRDFTHTVTNFELAKVLLGHTKSVDEVEALLQKLRVVGNEGPEQWRSHWAVQDKDGRSIVVEYIKGELQIHDNSVVGVLTNDPQYDWHLSNLDQYASVAPSQPDASAWSAGSHPSAVGHGLNLQGLPGGFSPAARFVRCFVLKQHLAFAAPPRTEDEAVSAITGILNNVHIAKGFVPLLTSDEKDASHEITHWSALKIPGKTEFWFRSYADMGWRRLAVGELEWGQGKTFDKIKVDDGVGFVDVSM